MAALLGDEVENVDGRVWGRQKRIPGGVFVGPLEVRRSDHKGRGLFATRDIFPGELLLAERALFDTNGRVPVEVAGTILALRSRQSRQNSAIWTALQGLHPTTLRQVSEDAVAAAHERYGEALMSKEDEGYEERLRLALTIQVNAASGQVFARLSLFNHSCREANAVRIDGLSGFGSHLLLCDHDPLASKGYAEVYATRQVKAGEELLVNYDDVESSTRRRRNRLRVKYDFECDCCRCDNSDKQQEEMVVEDDLDNIQQETEAAQCALERAIGLLGPNSPLVLRARRLVVKAAESDDDQHNKAGLVAKCLLVRNHEIHVFGDRHLLVAKTDLVAADAIETVLSSSTSCVVEDDDQGWAAVLSLGAEVVDQPNSSPPSRGSKKTSRNSLFEELEDLEFRLRLHAESIAHLYRESRAKNLAVVEEKRGSDDDVPSREASPMRPAHANTRILSPRLTSRSFK